MHKPNPKRKSSLKAAGVKGTFINDTSLLMTSFGKKESAHLEKVIAQKDITFETKPSNFHVELKEQKIKVIGSNHLQAEIDNPTIKNIVTNGQPLSHRQKRRQQRNTWLVEKGVNPQLLETSLKQRNRSILEKHFYGETFSHTVNIQIIHNMLDITKILSTFITNIVFAFNNIMDVQDQKEDQDDLIGKAYSYSFEVFSIKTDSPPTKKQENFKRLYQQLITTKVDDQEVGGLGSWFGQAFIKTQKPKQKSPKGAKNSSPKLIYRSEEEVYYLLQTLAYIRHNLIHNKWDESNKDSIFLKTEEYEPMWNFLDRLYHEKVTEINSNFLGFNERNVVVLLKLFNIEFNETKKEKLVSDFYRFVVLKDSLQLGFSLRKIREILLTFDEFIRLSSQEYDSIRSKLYTYFDFILYQKIRVEDVTFIDDIVKELRACIEVDGPQKDLIYEKYARRILPFVQTFVLEKLAKELQPDFFKTNNQDKIKETWIQTVKMNGIEAHPFVKLMYAFTLFLDAKDQNDVLTHLINKFSEIHSLNQFKHDHISRLGHPGRLKEAFAFFEGDLNKLSHQLHFLKSIVKMDHEPKLNYQAKAAALQILGFKLPPYKEEKEYIEFLFSKENPNKGFGNFIANNVIKSRRFIYLMKYVNPRHAHVIGHNRHIIEFILSRLPDTQLDRHYQLQMGSNNQLPRQEKVSFLTKKVTSVHLDQFLQVQQQAKARSYEAVQKEKYKQVIGLYLTCIYLFYKHLIQINARYTIAFQTFERDVMLYVKNIKPGEIYSQHEMVWALVNQRLQRHDYTTNIQTTIQKTMEQIPLVRIRKFRNDIAHLNLIHQAHYVVPLLKHVPRTYFALFHTLYQLHMLREFKNLNQNEEWLNTALESVKKYGGYSKKLLWSLLGPIAYNKARYHSLVMEKLFDMNE